MFVGPADQRGVDEIDATNEVLFAANDRSMPIMANDAINKQSVDIAVAKTQR